MEQEETESNFQLSAEDKPELRFPSLQAVCLISLELSLVLCDMFFSILIIGRWIWFLVNRKVLFSDVATLQVIRVSGQWTLLLPARMALNFLVQRSVE